MNLAEQNAAAEAFFQKCKDLLQTKGRDYTPDDIAFKEVRKTAEDLGISVEKALWVYARKHISAIEYFIKSGNGGVEGIASRLTDLANYSALIYVYLENEQEGFDAPKG